MSKQSNPVWTILGVIIGGYLILRFLPSAVNTLSSSFAGVAGGQGYGQGTGTNPFALSYRNKSGTVAASTTGDLQKTISSLVKALTKGPSMPVGPGAGGGGAPQLPFSGLLKPSPKGGYESISQALANGDYTGADQNTVAGIWNIQHGAGDFAGDTRDQVVQEWINSGDYTPTSGYTSPSLDNYQISAPSYSTGSFTDFTAQPINWGMSSAPSIDTSTNTSLDNYSFSNAEQEMWNAYANADIFGSSPINPVY